MMPYDFRAVGGVIGWVKKIYNYLVSIAEFIVSLVETLLEAITWIPKIIGSLFESVTFLPPLLGVFATLAVVLMTINYMADRK